MFGIRCSWFLLLFHHEETVIANFFALISSQATADHGRNICTPVKLTCYLLVIIYLQVWDYKRTYSILPISCVHMLVWCRKYLKSRTVYANFNFFSWATVQDITFPLHFGKYLKFRRLCANFIFCSWDTVQDIIFPLHFGKYLKFRRLCANFIFCSWDTVQDIIFPLNLKFCIVCANPMIILWSTTLFI